MVVDLALERAVTTHTINVALPSGAVFAAAGAVPLEGTRAKHLGLPGSDLLMTDISWVRHAGLAVVGLATSSPPADGIAQLTLQSATSGLDPEILTMSYRAVDGGVAQLAVLRPLAVKDVRVPPIAAATLTGDSLETLRFAIDAPEWEHAALDIFAPGFQWRIFGNMTGTIPNLRLARLPAEIALSTLGEVSVRIGATSNRIVGSAPWTEVDAPWANAAELWSPARKFSAAGR